MPSDDYRASACEGKVSFASFAQAQRVAERGSRRGRSRQVYHCPFCHAFHLGRRPVHGRKPRLQAKDADE